MWNGVRKYAKIPKWMDNTDRMDRDSFLGKLPFATIADSSDFLSELKLENSTLKDPVGPNTVEYSYQLKDFHDGYTILSNHTVHCCKLQLS